MENVQNIETNSFEDKTTKILRDIEENRLWTRKSNGKTKNVLDEELKVLIDNYKKILNEVSKNEKEYMQYELGKIVAEFSNVPTARYGFVDDSDIVRIQKNIEDKLSELLEQYNLQKTSNSLEMYLTRGKIDYYIEDLKIIPYASGFIEEYMKKFSVETKEEITDVNANLDSENLIEEQSVFDKNAYNSSNFIVGLNSCNTVEDIKQYIDSIVDGFEYNHVIPEKLGINASIGANSMYFNNGIYDEFISDKTLICPEALISQGYKYRITDRDYLYEFAIFVKKMNISNDSNLLPTVMDFLGSYFGFPKNHNVDLREDTLFNWASINAEKYLNYRNIPIDPQFGDALTQMQITGEYPIIAFKGASTAQCTERGTLAQNIMKVCGLRSFVMFGDCESRNEVGAHCWNGIADSNNNLMLIDFSNTVYSYTNGQFSGRKPFSVILSNHDLANQMNNIGFIEICDYHYENGKKVFDEKHRKYSLGRSLEIHSELTSENRLK